MDSNKEIRTLQIIYVAMTGFATAFAVIGIMLGGIAGKGELEQSESLLTMTFGGVTVLQIALSFFLPGRIHRIKEEATLREKLAAYRNAKTMTAALCEGAALLWGVLLLLTGNFWYALPMGLCLTMILTRFPSMMELEALLGKRRQDIDHELARAR